MPVYRSELGAVGRKCQAGHFARVPCKRSSRPGTRVPQKDLLVLTAGRVPCRRRKKPLDAAGCRSKCDSGFRTSGSGSADWRGCVLSSIRNHLSSKPFLLERTTRQGSTKTKRGPPCIREKPYFLRDWDRAPWRPGGPTSAGSATAPGQHWPSRAWAGGRLKWSPSLARDAMIASSHLGTPPTVAWESLRIR